MPGLLALIGFREAPSAALRGRPQRRYGMMAIALASRNREERGLELRGADRPPEERGLARDSVLMLAAYRAEREPEHAHFADLPQLLAPGDLVAINTSRTLPASLQASDAASGALQVLHLSTPAPGEPGATGASLRWIVELRNP